MFHQPPAENLHENEEPSHSQQRPHGPVRLMILGTHRPVLHQSGEGGGGRCPWASLLPCAHAGQPCATGRPRQRANRCASYQPPGHVPLWHHQRGVRLCVRGITRSPQHWSLMFYDFSLYLKQQCAPPSVRRG